MSSGDGGSGGGGDHSSGHYPMNNNSGGGNSWTSVVLTLILSLLIAVTLVILLYITAWCLLRRSTARRRSRINQLINEATIMRTDTYEQPPNNPGLNQSVIDSLPVFAFKELTNNQQDSKNGGSRECAVCLSLFQDEEMVRLLPNCKHFFHVDCINAWLRSNMTCPICRCSTTTATTQFPAPLPAEPLRPHRHEMGPVVVVVPSYLLDHPTSFSNS